MLYNVLQYLEKSCEKYPEKVAVIDEHSRITYRMYQEYAKKIGTFLCKRLNGAANRPVVVFIDRTALSLAAFLGVVYSGNFYVPVDAEMPEERIKTIYDTLRPELILDAADKIGAGRGLRVSEIIKRTQIDQRMLDDVRRDSVDMDPLYAMFTSGSTGIPKGVLISHRSVIDLAEVFADTFHFDSGNVFGNQAPFDFDVSVKDMYHALRAGGSVVILPKRLFKTPKLLVGYLRETGINTLIWAVSALRIVADFKTFDAAGGLELKYVMFSGEVMPVKVLNYWMDHIPQARYVNLYGPTEITCNCTYYEITHRFADDEVLPAGKAFKNSRVFLRDESGRILKGHNQLGEICVAGSCLALGYWNNPEKTAEAFARNVEVPEYREGIYATGDIGFYDKNDDIIYVSRKDFQIKHMGHRIELGEIEVALQALPCLEAACCLYDGQKGQIVCCYQAQTECRKEIVCGLSKKLPKYMYPNVWVWYKELPLNKNGKIDREVLRKNLE